MNRRRQDDYIRVRNVDTKGRNQQQFKNMIADLKRTRKNVEATAEIFEDELLVNEKKHSSILK